MKPRSSCLVRASAAAFLATSASAMWLRPNDVPVGRLLTNIENYVKEHPNDARGHFTLARVHSLAFARQTDTLSAFSDPQGRTLPSIPDLQVAQSRTEPRKEDLIVHLTESVRSFERALALDAESALSHLGLAYVLERGVVLADEVGVVPGAVPGEELNAEAKRERWRERAIEEYYRAYELAIVEDGEITEQPMRGLASLASFEAGSAYIKLMTARGTRDETEARQLAQVQREIKDLEAKPRSTAITPIIFSLEGASTLADLLALGNWVKFDLDGDGQPEPRPWLRPHTGILVWDPTHSGVITSGRQLFGSVTWWMFFPDGYRAMDILDDDRDGQLAGSELAGLAVWFDRNANGISESGDVIPIESLGIASLATRATSTEDGSPANRSGLSMSDGRVLPTYDWIAPAWKDPCESLDDLLVSRR